jgi:hypothetical protein
MVAPFPRLWLAGYILTAPVLATDEMEHFSDFLLLANESFLGRIEHKPINP